jgi:ABC-type transport system involved in Fe-S cluster assembly fused permease/ATPase subunit
MVTFEWSWFAFVIGVVATLFVEFWVLVAIAVSQFRKQKQNAKKAAETVDAFSTWINDKL